MRKLMIIILAAILASSCEMEKEQGKVVFVSVAIDYGAPSGVNALENPPEDQRVLSAQIETLTAASGDIYEEYLFLEKNGKRSLNGNNLKWNYDDILWILSELDTISTDLIIFHYSGHGDETGALVTDANTVSRLQPERLLDAMTGIDGRKCLFLDSCFSGHFVKDAGYMANGEKFRDGNLETDNLVNAIMPAFDSLKKEHGNDSIWVLAAATDEQNSFDSWDNGLPGQDGFGAFSYYLAAALGYDMEHDRPGIPAEGTEITFYGIYHEIRDSMAADLRKEATPQVTLTLSDPILFST